jgi:hypothetical protein
VNICRCYLSVCVATQGRTYCSCQVQTGSYPVLPCAQHRGSTETRHTATLHHLICVVGKFALFASDTDIVREHACKSISIGPEMEKWTRSSSAKTQKRLSMIIVDTSTHVSQIWVRCDLFVAPILWLVAWLVALRTLSFLVVVAIAGQLHRI